jgi:hypothetical protein
VANDTEIDPGLIDVIENVHTAVDRLAAPLAQRLRGRLQCKAGCSGCCVDNITVYEVEAAVIQRHHAELLEETSPSAPGACAFLDGQGACRIYAHRPYVCRTQGLPLRWMEERPPARGVKRLRELRDICGLNDVGEPSLEQLPVGDCWTIGPFEDRLAAAQQRSDGGQMRRVALRSLFRRSWSG